MQTGGLKTDACEGSSCYCKNNSQIEAVARLPHRLNIYFCRDFNLTKKISKSLSTLYSLCNVIQSQHQLHQCNNNSPHLLLLHQLCKWRRRTQYVAAGTQYILIHEFTVGGAPSRSFHRCALCHCYHLKTLINVLNEYDNKRTYLLKFFC